MSLQGSLDTFEIPDVLRLLSSTKKTGHLNLSGDRGTGSLWVKDGDIVHSEASAAPWASNNAEVVFELLRYSQGDFAFYADEETDAKGRKPEKVDPVLNSAKSMLEEWESIEKVVPSLASPLKLAGKLPGASIEITDGWWKMLVGIGSGTTVGELGNMLEQSEIVVSRNIKQLIEAKLVEIEYATPVLPNGTPLAGAETGFVVHQEVSTSSVSAVESGGSVAHEEAALIEQVLTEPVNAEQVNAEQVNAGQVNAEPYAPAGENRISLYDVETEPGFQSASPEAPLGVNPVEVEPTSAFAAESSWAPETNGGVAHGATPPSPFDFASPEEVVVEEQIDLDDPVQIAKAIEAMSPEVTRSVTLAARAETEGERESILRDIQQGVSPLDFAVIQRFVYSLI